MLPTTLTHHAVCILSVQIPRRLMPYEDAFEAMMRRWLGEMAHSGTRVSMRCRLAGEWFVLELHYTLAREGNSFPNPLRDEFKFLVCRHFGNEVRFDEPSSFFTEITVP